MVDSIQLKNLGRRFKRQWLFRNLETTFFKGDKVAVLGGNGSGKSSLTSIISGYLSPSEGQVHWYKENGELLSSECWWKEMGWCAPALELPMSLTITEVVILYHQMRGFSNGIEVTDVLSALELDLHLNKPLFQLSSGMRQRVKLMIAFALKSDVLILDEPTAHLDAKSIAWFKNQMNKIQHPLVFIASNHDENEIGMCNVYLEINPDGQVAINRLQS